MRPRSNPIWLVGEEEFAGIIRDAKSYKDVLSSFGLKNKGHAHEVLKKRMAEDGVDGSHLEKRWDAIARHGRGRKIPLDEILIEGSSYNRCHLKKRLLENGILKNECSECGKGPHWNGKPLVMVLDHINGVHNDNRRNNLRMLCPNCNSQQTTFAGRNRTS